MIFRNKGQFENSHLLGMKGIPHLEWHQTSPPKVVRDALSAFWKWKIFRLHSENRKCDRKYRNEIFWNVLAIFSIVLRSMWCSSECQKVLDILFLKFSNKSCTKIFKSRLFYWICLLFIILHMPIFHRKLSKVL